VAYDPADDRMYVPTVSASYLAVYNATNLSLIEKVPIGGQTQAAWDPVNDEVYVTSWYSATPTNNVTVLDGATGAILTNVTGIPAPNTVVYDPTTATIYTGDENAAEITEIDPGTNRAVGNFSVEGDAGLAPLNGTDLLFATNGSGEVSEINTSTGSSTEIGAGQSTAGMAWLPSGVLAAADQSGGVYFLATGTLAPLANVSLSISPSVVTVGASVNLTTLSSGGSAPLDFSYQGLPAGCSTMDDPNVTCSPSAPGLYIVMATVTDASGTTAQASAALWVEGGFRVTFRAVGLPPRISWSVDLSDGQSFSSNSSQVTFLVTDGWYNYTVACFNGTYAAPPGTLDVVSAPQSLYVTFTRVTYQVTFVAEGLATGEQWFVNLTNGTSYSSSAPSFVESATNGSYAFTVSAKTGQFHAPSGEFTVDGSSTTVTLSFTEVTFVVIFSEAGLPNGSAWSVQVNGGPAYPAVSGTVQINLDNGTYTITPIGPSGFRASEFPSVIHVDGAGVSGAVLFVPSSPASGPGFLGLSGDTGYALVAGIGAVVAALVGGLLITRRRRGRPPRFAGSS